MSGGIVRLRAPHNVHVLSWILSLEKTGSVACHFSKCKFMAISVEEMANHYKFCKCDTIVLPHECDICHQKTDCDLKLLYHMIYGHSYKATSEELRELAAFLSCEKKRITPALRRSWKIFHGNKGYFLCLQKPCYFVPETIEEMESHYLHHCKEEFWKCLTFACEICHGRFYSKLKLISHKTVVHDPKNQRKKFTKPGVSDQDLLKNWANAIVKFKQAKCPVEQCKFVCNSISALEKHYKFCNGEQRFYVTCPLCDCWVLNEGKLREHRKCIHKEVEVIVCNEEVEENFSSMISRSTQTAVEVTERSNPKENNEDLKHDDLTHEEEYIVSNEMRNPDKDYCMENVKVKSEPPDFDESQWFMKTESPNFEEQDPLLLPDTHDLQKATEDRENTNFKSRLHIPEYCEPNDVLNANNSVSLEHSSGTLQTTNLTTEKLTSNAQINSPNEIVPSPFLYPDLIKPKNVLCSSMPDVLQQKRSLRSNISDSEILRDTLLGNKMETPKTYSRSLLSKEPCHKQSMGKSETKYLRVINLTDEYKAFGNEVADALRNIQSEEKRKLLKRKIQEAITSVCNIDSEVE